MSWYLHQYLVKDEFHHPGEKSRWLPSASSRGGKRRWARSHWGWGGRLGGPNGDMGKRVQTGDVQVMTWGQGWGYSRVLVQRDELNFGQIEFKGCKPAGG